MPPAKHAEGKTADDFGIPMNYFGNDVEPHLYLIPTSLYKLHPVMDEAMSKLLIKDPLGLILMVEGKSSNLERYFEQAHVGKYAHGCVRANNLDKADETTRLLSIYKIRCCNHV